MLCVHCEYRICFKQLKYVIENNVPFDVFQSKLILGLVAFYYSGPFCVDVEFRKMEKNATILCYWHDAV